MRSLVIIFSCFFKIFFFKIPSFPFEGLIFMCLVWSLWVNLLVPCFWHVYIRPSPNLRQFQLLFLQILSLLLSLLSGSPAMLMLVHLMVSHRSLRLFSHFFSFYSSCCSDSIISTILDSSSLIIYSACSKLSLNHPSSKLIIPVTVLFSFRIACWVLLRFSISLLIFPFCPYIILFTEKINIKTS